MSFTHDGKCLKDHPFWDLLPKMSLQQTMAPCAHFQPFAKHWEMVLFLLFKRLSLDILSDFYWEYGLPELLNVLSTYKIHTERTATTHHPIVYVGDP